MKTHAFPYYWFLFPPCEGCTVLRPHFRPVVVLRPRFAKFRLPKFVYIRGGKRPRR